MKIRFYEKLGYWRWSISAGNNRVLCRSAKGYSTKRACERGFWNFAVDMSGDPSLHEVLR